MKRRSAFWRCLWPRLALAAYFSAVGFLGGGGDAEAYHVVGMHMKKVWEQGYADFEVTIAETGWHDATPFADNYMGLYLHAIEPNFDPIFFNSISIIYLHAALYRIWANPFMFVAFTALLSAWATSRFISVFPYGRYERWLIYNPVSIFLSAIHYKESIVESMILLAVIYWYGERKYVRAAIASVLAGLFRLSYAPLIGVVLFAKFIRRIPTRTLFAGAFLTLIIVPPFYWQLPHGRIGPFYSLLYANVWTKKTITPLFGMLQPLPFVTWTDLYSTIFYTVYGLVYLPILAGVVVWSLLNRRNNVMITATLVVNLVISYYSQAVPATKARYFAPFFPLMIAGYLAIRPALNAELRRIFGLNRVPGLGPAIGPPVASETGPGPDSIM